MLRRHTLAGLVAVASVALLATCQPIARDAPAASADRGPLRYRLSTTAVDDGRYVIERSASGTTVSVRGRSPGGAGRKPTRDGRTLWTYPGEADSLNQSSCVTWTTVDGETSQPGVALRIRTDRSRIRAITVTNNIVLGIRWRMNVHVWDSAVTDTDGQPKPVLLEAFDVSAGLDDGTGQLEPLPWRLCARVRGARVELKAWATVDPEPQWGDGIHGGAVTVPTAWQQPGRAGWFAGHLGTNGTLSLTDLTTTVLPG